MFSDSREKNNSDLDTVSLSDKDRVRTYASKLALEYLAKMLSDFNTDRYPV